MSQEHIDKKEEEENNADNNADENQPITSSNWTQTSQWRPHSPNPKSCPAPIWIISQVRNKRYWNSFRFIYLSRVYVCFNLALHSSLRVFQTGYSLVDSVWDDCDFLETSIDICDFDSSHSSRITSWTDVRGIAKLVWVFRCDLAALDGVLALSDFSDNLSNPSIFWIFSWFWNWRICLVAELVLGKLNYVQVNSDWNWSVYLCDRGCMILFIPSCETPEKTDDASDWAPLGLLGLKIPDQSWPIVWKFTLVVHHQKLTAVVH